VLPSGAASQLDPSRRPRQRFSDRLLVGWIPGDCGHNLGHGETATFEEAGVFTRDSGLVWNSPAGGRCSDGSDVIAIRAWDADHGQLDQRIFSDETQAGSGHVDGTEWGSSNPLLAMVA
jgi:hypothetical protein